MHSIGFNIDTKKLEPIYPFHMAKKAVGEVFVATSCMMKPLRHLSGYLRPSQDKGLKHSIQVNMLQSEGTWRSVCRSMSWIAHLAH
jgi:hypothetical protein